MGLEQLPAAPPAGSFDAEDDGFVLIGAHPGAGQPDFRPAPSAPSLPQPGQYPAVPQAGASGSLHLPPQASQHDSVRIAYSMASEAIQLDYTNNHVEAVKRYTSAIAHFNWCLRQGLLPEEPQLRGCLQNYTSRKEVLERNIRHYQQAGSHSIDRPKAQASHGQTTSSSSASSAPEGQRFGWDGTTFSGERRKQFDLAEELKQRAELNEAEGNYTLARQNLTEAAELLLAFAKTEPDKKVKLEVTRIAGGLIESAEAMQKKAAKK